MVSLDENTRTSQSFTVWSFELDTKYRASLCKKMVLFAIIFMLCPLKIQAHYPGHTPQLSGLAV